MEPTRVLDPYTVKKDQQGQLINVVRRELGQDVAVPLDPNDAEYCKFVTWAANQGSAITTGYGALKGGNHYLGTEDEVVRYCKNRAIVLLTATYDEIRYSLFGAVDTARGAIALNSEQPDAPDPIVLEHSSLATVTSPTGVLGRIHFHRLYKAAPKSSAKSNDQSDGLAPERLPLFVSHTLYARLNEMLNDPDSDIRRLSDWPIERTFVYFDISGFSQHLPGQQVLIINALIGLTNDDKWWPAHSDQAKARSDREASLCIGDGYIFVFKDSYAAAYFTAYLANLIERLCALSATGQIHFPQFHFRASVHTGPVYRFWDPTGVNEGRWNYIGKGITDGERVLGAIGKDRDDIVFISAETRQRITADDRDQENPISEYLQNRGRHRDKHGIYRRVYEVNHTGWTVIDVDRAISDNRDAMRKTYPT